MPGPAGPDRSDDRSGGVSVSDPAVDGPVFSGHQARRTAVSARRRRHHPAGPEPGKPDPLFHLAQRRAGGCHRVDATKAGPGGRHRGRSLRAAVLRCRGVGAVPGRPRFLLSQDAPAGPVLNQRALEPAAGGAAGEHHRHFRGDDLPWVSDSATGCGEP